MDCIKRAGRAKPVKASPSGSTGFALPASPARVQRCHCQRVRRSSECVPRAAAAADLGLASQMQAPSSGEMWDMGFADCEADTCGIVPDGSLVLVIRPYSANRAQRPTYAFSDNTLLTYRR